MFVFAADIEPAVLAQPQQRAFHARAVETACGRLAVIDLDLAAGVVLLHDEVDHPPVGREAVTLGHFFGKDLDPFDGFGRIAAEFAEGRNAQAVDQEDRLPATATPAGGAGLRRQLLDEIGDRAGAVGSDIRLVQFDDRRFGCVDLAAQRPPDDEDFVALHRRFRIRDIGVLRDRRRRVLRSGDGGQGKQGNGDRAERGGPECHGSASGSGMVGKQAAKCINRCQCSTSDLVAWLRARSGRLRPARPALRNRPHPSPLPFLLCAR